MTPQEFDEEFGPEFAPRTSPYGYAAQPVKPGLTKRGKIAIAVAGAAIAGTGFFWYQAHSAQVAKDAKETAALQIQLQQIELEKMKELNKANAEHSKEKATEDAQRKKFVDACIDADKGLVGKQLGVTYSSVVADCQNQFQARTSTSVDGSDMAAAGSSTDTPTGAGAINSTGLMAIAGATGLFVVGAAIRGRRKHAQ